MCRIRCLVTPILELSLVGNHSAADLTNYILVHWSAMHWAMTTRLHVALNWQEKRARHVNNVMRIASCGNASRSITPTLATPGLCLHVNKLCNASSVLWRRKLERVNNAMQIASSGDASWSKLNKYVTCHHIAICKYFACYYEAADLTNSMRCVRFVASR